MFGWIDVEVLVNFVGWHEDVVHVVAALDFVTKVGQIKFVGKIDVEELVNFVGWPDDVVNVIATLDFVTKNG